MALKFRLFVLFSVAFAFDGASNYRQASGGQVINFLSLGDSIASMEQYKNGVITRLGSQGYSVNFLPSLGQGGFVIDEITGGRFGRKGVRNYINDEYLGTINMTSMKSYLSSAPVNSSDTWIFLMAGINDCAGYEVASAPQRMAALVSDLRTLAPLANVIVSNITPGNNYNAVIDANVTEYNQQFMAAMYGLGDPKVTPVDCFSVFPPDDPAVQPNLDDFMWGPTNVHPNLAGGNLMAGPIAAAVPEPGFLASIRAGGFCLLFLAWFRRARPK